MNPIVSVIVPIYNVELYLERCINSLLNQSFDNYEIVLVDDGSPDNCPAICDSFSLKDERVKVIHKTNGGLSSARNAGLSIAKGEYISFVDSDDFVTTDMLEILVGKAKNYNSDVVYANHFRCVGERILGPVEERAQDVVYDGDETLRFALDMIANEPNKENDTPTEVSVWAALFKKSLLISNGIEFVSERQYISEDVVFNLELLPKANRVVLCPEAVYYYYFNSASLSKSIDKERFQKDKILYEYIRKKAPLLWEDYQERLYRFLIARARCAISIIANSKRESLKNKRCLILGIINDGDYQNALEKYPISKLSFKKRFFCKVSRLKMITVLILLCNLNKRHV